MIEGDVDGFLHENVEGFPEKMISDVIGDLFAI